MNTKIYATSWLLSVAALLISPVSVYPQDEGSIANCAVRARQAEMQGQWKQAGEQYFSMLKCMLGGFGGRQADLASPELRSAVGRRAVACLTISADSEIRRAGPGGEVTGCESLEVLMQTYDLMKQVEPTSPTWPYLLSACYCAQGRYVEARTELQRSIRAAGGQQSVKKKAEVLLAHINPYASTDQARMTAQDSASLRMLLSGQIAHDFGPVNRPSPSIDRDQELRNQNKQWNEGVAKQNAWEAGDMPALNRMNGGVATDNDKGRYGGGW